MRAVIPIVTPDIRAFRQRTGADRWDEVWEGVLHMPPLVVVEIRSPGDETAEKMAFYAKLGVPEVWIADRDTKVPEVHVLEGADYKSQAPDNDGWIHSAAAAVWLRGESDRKLAMQVANQPNTKQLLPED